VNILNLPTGKANYVPSFVNATSVSPGGENEKNWTAEELVNRIMGRKAFSRIPIELLAAISEAERYGEHNMANQLNQSLHNLQGSILLDLKNEADEGSLAMAWIKNRLLDFPNAIPNYVPFIPPLRHPENIKQMTLGEMPPTTPPTEPTEEAPPTKPLSQHAKNTFMASLIQRFDMYQSLDETFINLGTQGQPPQTIAARYEEMLSQEIY